MAQSLSKQLDKIEETLKRKVKENGLGTVFDAVRQEGRRQVVDEVYLAYEPTVYERTGGLWTQWGYVPENELGISVFNTRRDELTYKDIAETVITGEGYDIKGVRQRLPYEVPRPFIATTIDALEVSGDHVFAYADALREAGFEVEVKSR